MIINVTEFMLKDIGSSGYTEYEFGIEMIDLYEERPELLIMKMGHLHTHHQMKAYFSGTDKQCLHDNAPNFDMFLSIIINTEGMKIAKIAFVSEIKHIVSFMNVKRLFSFTTKPEKHLAILDAEVEILQDDVVEEFAKVLVEKEEKQAKAKAAHKIAHKNYSTGINSNGRKTVIHSPQYIDNIGQLEAFNDFPSETSIENENEALFEDDYIEDILVRSFYRDDLAAETLEVAIADIRGELNDNTQKATVNMMVDHFITCVNEEYYGDDFERMVNKCVRILAEYRDKFRFINQFIYHIRQWVNSHNASDDGGGGDDSYYGNPFREDFTKSKNKIENEF